MYIQVFGNVVSIEVREKLLENFENCENDLWIRVECVWVFRCIFFVVREKVSYIGFCVREY